MDILYIVGKGCSRCDDFELRCSLRSIAQFGKNVGKVYVVGYCPEWLSDEVVKIPFEREVSENSKTKQDNIRKAIEYAVDNSDISEEFLISMDDHFYVRPVNFGKYPYYNKCYFNRECKELLPSYEQDKDKKDGYTNMLRNTRAYLEEFGLPYYNLTLHRNMHCSKTIIKECKKYNKSGIESMCLWLNYQYAKKPFKKKICNDIKLTNGGQWWKTDAKRTEVFSTYDFEVGSGLYVLLSGLYNKKCKYEK